MPFGVVYNLVHTKFVNVSPFLFYLIYWLAFALSLAEKYAWRDIVNEAVQKIVKY